MTDAPTPSKKPAAAKPKAPAKAKAAPKAAPSGKSEISTSPPAYLASAAPDAPVTNVTPITPKGKLVTLPIGAVFPSPFNPRRAMDEDALELLGASIIADGQIQPIVVRARDMGITVTINGAPHPTYEIAAGERRWRSLHRRAERGEIGFDYPIMAVERELTDSALILLAVTENLGRVDMDPLDEAMAFKLLGETLKAEGVAGKAAELVAERIGVTPRTVYRRLALLNCAEPVQQALREKRINLQQAAAFSVGEKDAQIAHFTRMVDNAHQDWLSDPDDIQETMTHAYVPVGLAQFPLENFTGEIITDPETGEAFFAQFKQFEQAQLAVFRARIAELEAKWPWVVHVQAPHEYHRYETSGTGTGERGCVVWISHGPYTNDITLQIKENAWPLRKAEASTGTTKNSTAPAEERHLTAAQKIAVATAKTRAMRRAIGVDVRAGLCIAIVGLLGTRDIWIGELSGAPHDIHESLEIERFAINELLAKAMHGATLKLGSHFRLNADGAAKLYTSLHEQMSIEDLTELFCRLTAERVGARTGYDTALGDNPLTIAIADSVNAADMLPETWTATRDYFAAYSRDRLLALAQAHGIEGANKMKKGELVDALWNFGAAYWTPDRFHELEFLSAKDLKKRLAGPEKPGPALQAGEAA